MLNILCCIRSTVLHNKVGGMESITHVICKGLTKMGHDVTCISTSIDPNDTNDLETWYDGVRYILLHGCNPGKYSDEFHRAVQNFVEVNHDYNLIYSASTAAISMTNNKYNIPVIITWHATLIQDIMDDMLNHVYVHNKILYPFHVEELLINVLPKTYHYKKEILEKFTHHIAIFEYMKKTIKLFSIDSNKISVIENCVPNNFSNSRSLQSNTLKESFGIDKNKICIGVVGRFKPLKGHQILVNALNLLEDKEKYQIFLVGNGEDIDYYKDTGLSIVTKVFTHNEMPTAYRAMDIFVNPTLTVSSYDLTVKEALSCGTKTIATKGHVYESLFKITQEKFGNKNPFDIFNIADAQSLKNSIIRIQKRKTCDDFSFFDSLYSEELMLSKYNTIFQKYAIFT